MDGLCKESRQPTGTWQSPYLANKLTPLQYAFHLFHASQLHADSFSCMNKSWIETEYWTRRESHLHNCVWGAVWRYVAGHRAVPPRRPCINTRRPGDLKTARASQESRNLVVRNLHGASFWPLLRNQQATTPLCMGRRRSAE